MEVPLVGGATMIAEERLALDTPPPVQPARLARPAPEMRPTSVSMSPEPTSLLWRLILVVVGFGIAFTGFMLILSVFLVFIGLPMFIFGLALMQAQQT
jgi:hypothetical protein